MRRILVTGGLGRSGRWIVDRLADENDLLVLDKQSGGVDHPNVDARVADLRDRGSVYDLTLEFDPDAVVHWGAIPDPLSHAGGEVFENNVCGAYNVLDAAGRVEADVVLASSESAHGFAFSADRSLPPAAPLTEAHALRPADPYGTSKLVAEEIAEMVVRRDGIDVASIRPSWIQYPGEYPCRDVDTAREGEGAENFWSYVDVRDVVDMVAAALEADVDGHEPFLAVAAENYAGEPTVDLFERHFGRLPPETDLVGEQSAFSSGKAQSLLDWEPTHSWREAADADVAGPTV